MTALRFSRWTGIGLQLRTMALSQSIILCKAETICFTSVQPKTFGTCDCLSHHFLIFVTLNCYIASEIKKFMPEIRQRLKRRYADGRNRVNWCLASAQGQQKKCNIGLQPISNSSFICLSTWLSGYARASPDFLHPESSGSGFNSQSVHSQRKPSIPSSW